MELKYTEQVLTQRKDKPIVIETPAGLVLLHRDAEDLRKIRMELPPGVRAFVGKEKLLLDSKFVQEQNGKIVPKCGMLTPLYEDGEFIGFGQPDVIELEI